MIVVTKMDLTELPFCQNRFNQISDQMNALARSSGYRPDWIATVPVSGLKGDNLYEGGSSNMPWYRGFTKSDSQSTPKMSLFNAMDSYTVDARPKSIPCRVPIQRVYRVCICPSWHTTLFLRSFNVHHVHITLFLRLNNVVCLLNSNLKF